MYSTCKLYMCIYTRARKKGGIFNAKFLPSKFRCYYTHFNVCTCALVHVQTTCVANNFGVLTRKVEAVLLAASVSFLSPAMLNPSRNSDRNKTSTRSL